MPQNKTILVAPLNWGLGHATRCIPIINALLQDGFKVLLGSDGPALLLLQKQFPQLECLELPSYQIEYAKKGRNFKWKMLLRSPKVISAIREERKLIKALVKSGTIDGIISDNRLGLYHHKIPTVFMTHQLQVLSGSTTKLTSALHRSYIKRFDTCWVPDYEGPINLSGKLGHPKNIDFNVTYIGPLSRMQCVKSDTVYDVMVLLSGPEPQRTELDELLMYELKHYNGNVLFVRGLFEENQCVELKDQIRTVNFMETRELEMALNQSELIICRSGYTTVMDLTKIGKKAFFIPTPGQSEQEYLANRFKKMGIAPFADQDNFSLKQLSQVKHYPGLSTSIISSTESGIDLRRFFSLFKGERKLRAHSKIAFYINLFVMSLNNMLDDRQAQS